MRGKGGSACQDRRRVDPGLPAHRHARSGEAAGCQRDAKRAFAPRRERQGWRPDVAHVFLESESHPFASR